MRLSVMGQILRRRRRLLASLAVLGAVAGTLAWVLVPAAFASTSKVLMQGSRAALGAVARLAGAVADDGQVSVLTDLTDCPQLTAAVEPPAAGDDPEAVPVEVTTRRSPGPAPTTVLRVVSVTATRPTIPSDSEASSAVLVVTAGTRTGWELLAVAEACHEAMLPVLGAVVVVAPGEEETVEGKPQPAAPQQSAAAAGQLNGQLTGGRA